MHAGGYLGVTVAALAAAYYADLDPEHFQIPAAGGLAESWDNDLGRDSDDSLQLVAEERMGYRRRSIVFQKRL